METLLKTNYMKGDHTEIRLNSVNERLLLSVIQIGLEPVKRLRTDPIEFKLSQKNSMKDRMNPDCDSVNRLLFKYSYN